MNTAQKAEYDTALLAARRNSREELRRSLKREFVGQNAVHILPIVGGSAVLAVTAAEKLFDEIIKRHGYGGELDGDE